MNKMQLVSGEQAASCLFCPRCSIQTRIPYWATPTAFQGVSPQINHFRVAVKRGFLESFHLKINFVCMWMKTSFHNN